MNKFFKLNIVFIILSSSLFAQAKVDEFKQSDKNHYLCKKSFGTYVVLNNKNASIVKINSVTFFKLNGENIYIPQTLCSKIKDHKKAIIF